MIFCIHARCSRKKNKQKQKSKKTGKQENKEAHSGASGCSSDGSGGSDGGGGSDGVHNVGDGSGGSDGVHNGGDGGGGSDGSGGSVGGGSGGSVGGGSGGSVGGGSDGLHSGGWRQRGGDTGGATGGTVGIDSGEAFCVGRGEMVGGDGFDTIHSDAQGLVGLVEAINEVVGASISLDEDTTVDSEGTQIFFEALDEDTNVFGCAIAFHDCHHMHTFHTLSVKFEPVQGLDRVPEGCIILLEVDVGPVAIEGAHDRMKARI